MRDKIQILLSITIIFIWFISSFVSGIQVTFPGIIGFTSMTDSISMGTISSGMGSSSNLEFSSDTLIVTGGTTKPTPVPTIAATAGPGSLVIPAQWTQSNQPGIFVDPITSTSWIYDPVFMRYIAPAVGWFLIVKGNQLGEVEGFYYYDIVGKKLYNSLTGEIIPIEQTGITSGGTPISGGISGGANPTSIPSSIPTSIPSGPVIVAGSQDQQTETNGQYSTQSTNPNEGCLVVCQSCPSGYCNDCNNNGTCDEEEGSLQTDSIGGIDENPQDSIQRDRNLSNQSGDIDDGGLSEEPQSSIHYMRGIGYGPFEVIECIDPYPCLYCIDENRDGLCSETDCHLISCDKSMDCIYCLDCDHDGDCDTDKIIITNCTEEEPCISFDYCDDSDLDGMCNLKLIDPELNADSLSQNMSNLIPVEEL